MKNRMNYVSGATKTRKVLQQGKNNCKKYLEFSDDSNHLY